MSFDTWAELGLFENAYEKALDRADAGKQVLILNVDKQNDPTTACITIVFGLNEYRHLTSFEDVGLAVTEFLPFEDAELLLAKARLFL